VGRGSIKFDREVEMSMYVQREKQKSKYSNNVVDFIGATKGSDGHYNSLCMQHGGDDLFTVLEEKKLSTDDLTSITIDMLKGIDCFHGLSLVLGDVKIENFVVDAKGNGRIIDLGTVEHENAAAHDIDTTARNAPPEYFHTRIPRRQRRRNQFHSPRAKSDDIWQAGVALFCAWFKFHPIQIATAIKNDDYYHLLLHNKARVASYVGASLRMAQQSTQTPGWVLPLLQKMMSINANQRPTIEQILSQLHKSGVVDEYTPTRTSAERHSKKRKYLQIS